MERLDKYSSSAVNLMKACCLIGVVAIHSDPMLYHYESRQGLELLAFILEQLQYVCVPFFFMLSGYLFFYNLQGFDFSAICRKWKSRIKSLVVPYILWGTIFAMARFLGAKYFGFESFGTFVDGKFSFTGFLTCFWDTGYGYPLDFPLWFVRNLIIFVVCAPVVYFIGKYWVLTAICVLLSTFNIPTFSAEFFIYGAALGIHQINPYKVLQKHIWSISVVWLMAMYLCNYRTERFMDILYVSGFGVLAPLFVLAVKRFPRVSKFADKQSNAFFFIYALHGMYAPKLTEILEGIIGYANAFSWLATLLLATLLNTLLGYLIYVVAVHLLPRFTNLLCGGRQQR